MTGIDGSDTEIRPYRIDVSDHDLGASRRMHVPWQPRCASDAGQLKMAVPTA